MNVFHFSEIVVFFKGENSLNSYLPLKFYCFSILYMEQALAYSGELLKVKGLQLPTAWLIG